MTAEGELIDLLATSKKLKYDLPYIGCAVQYLYDVIKYESKKSSNDSKKFLFLLPESIQKFKKIQDTTVPGTASIKIDQNQPLVANQGANNNDSNKVNALVRALACPTAFILPDLSSNQQAGISSAFLIAVAGVAYTLWKKQIATKELLSEEECINGLTSE